MKELFFVSSYPDRIAYLLDEAEMMTRLGHEVTVITCNRNIRRCNANMTCNKLQCVLCERYTKKILKKCSKNITVVSLDSFTNQEIKDSIEKLSFDYNNIDDIKKIKYHDSNVGFGSLSLYISLTRNLTPLMDSKFRLFFDKLLKDTCYMSVLQEEAIKKLNPDRISLFNGRFPEVRGALDYALAHNIELKSCEYTKVFPEFYLKRYFHNSLPHSMSNNVNMINSLWDSAGLSDMDKESLGRWFFDSKINQLFYGDKNYVAGQDKTLLPKEWSDEQINYVIFNSSEDEFVSIGDEYENAKLFNTQYEGIRHIAELLSERKNIHIYLRIHPNLRTIKYRYHTELLELGVKYPNLTVIPADSKISSYTLLLKANRVIVFGSTIGVEASYAGKPVINLCKYIYSDLNVVYDPHTIEEADNLLLSEHLETKPQIGSIKFGLYYMNPYATSYTFFNINIKRFSFWGHNFTAYPLAKLWGSSRLYAIITTFLINCTHKMKLPREEFHN
jgi:hypothetical protein